MRLGALLALLLSLMVPHVAAWADAATVDPTSAAKDHFRNGTRLYDLGKYLEAAAEYEQAFTLSERPAFLFNIGQAYRLGGKPREAIAAYQGFLRRLPTAAQRAEVETQVKQLQKQIEEDDARAAAIAEQERLARLAQESRAAEPTRSAPLVTIEQSRPPAPQIAPPVYKRWWVWTVVGVVVVGAGVGIGLGVGLGSTTRGRVLETPEVIR